MISFHFTATVSLFIFGLHYATQYDSLFKRIPNPKDPCGEPIQSEQFNSRQILWFLRWISLRILGQYLSKPLFTCPVCMASVWTIVLFLVEQWYQWGQVIITQHNAIQCLVSIAVVGGTNHVLKNFI